MQFIQYQNIRDSRSKYGSEPEDMTKHSCIKVLNNFGERAKWLDQLLRDLLENGYEKTNIFIKTAPGIN